MLWNGDDDDAGDEDDSDSEGVPWGVAGEWADGPLPAEDVSSSTVRNGESAKARYVSHRFCGSGSSWLLHTCNKSVYWGEHEGLSRGGGGGGISSSGRRSGGSSSRAFRRPPQRQV